MVLQEEGELDEIFESRNPGWMARIATVLVLILLAVGVYFYLDADKDIKDPSQLPLITENHPPEKAKPADPGGMDIPHQDASVYDHLDKDTAKPETEKLMPTAETPVAAMDATAPPSTPANLPAVLPSLPAAPQQETAPQQAATPPEPAASTAVAADNTAGDLAKIVQQAAAANEPAPTDDAAARIQLGAVSSQAAADAEWTRVKGQYGDELKGLNAHFSQVNLGDKGTFVRIQTEAMPEADAEARCQKLKLANQACMVVKAAQ